MFKKFAPFILIIFLLLPLLFPLLVPGFFSSDDGNWMVIRLSAFHETLKTGQFPVRFLERLNHGYGYPVLNFLYPLPFYLGETLHLFGLSFIVSVKVLFLLSFILGSGFMYFWLRLSTSKFGAVVGAVIYSFFIYRITDVYERGSLGESVAFIFIPLLLLFIQKKHIYLAVFALAALITSHNSLALMFLPVIFGYAFLVAKVSFFDNLKLLLLSLGLSAFFWLPALVDLSATKALTTQVASYQDYFVKQSSLLIFLEILIPVILALVLIKKEKLFWITVSLLGLFLTLPLSSFLWQTLPLPKLVQFPWRFLALSTLGVATLSAFLAGRHKILGCLLLVGFMVFGLLNLRVTHTFFPDSYYTTNDDTTTVKNEYMPIWVKDNPTSRPVAKYEERGTKLQINTVYFPGITVLVDGKPVAIDYTTNGLLLIARPANLTSIRVVYTEPPLHKIANLLTLVTLFAVLFLLLQPRLRHDH